MRRGGGSEGGCTPPQMLKILKFPPSKYMFSCIILRHFIIFKEVAIYTTGLGIRVWVRVRGKDLALGLGFRVRVRVRLRVRIRVRVRATVVYTRLGFSVRVSRVYGIFHSKGTKSSFGV